MSDAAHKPHRNRDFPNFGSPAQVPPAHEVPLDQINMSDAYIFEAQKHYEYFARLRKEAPVHYCKDSEFGPFWSITRYKDIAEIDKNHQVFSSAGSITLLDPDPEFETSSFIAMDPPKHDQQRKAVSPAVAPPSLAKLQDLVRERIADILDRLPIGETFDWVKHVSVEVTAMTLATLFDVPQADRHKLIRWSDIATAASEDEPLADGTYISEEARKEELMACLSYFTEKWRSRTSDNNMEGFDFLSLLANNPGTAHMVDDPQEMLGNLMLLIVGGNDTTRNSISGGVLALNNYPAEYAKLRSNPDLIPNMVSEIIRWVSPLAHMRRTATQDYEIGGKTIRKGEKVAMWYISGNRDEDAIDRANLFLIDRPKARQHISFGFGIHRCMGNRVAELQLRILWEEITRRFESVQVVGPAKHLHSCFVMGISELPVRLIPKSR